MLMAGAILAPQIVQQVRPGPPIRANLGAPRISPTAAFQGGSTTL